MDSEQVDAVADERQQPVSTGSVGNVSSDRAKAIAEELAHTRNHADDRSAQAKRAEKRPVDALAMDPGDWFEHNSESALPPSMTQHIPVAE